MRKIKIAVVGYGNRGGVYASYALSRPEEAEICAVVDCLEFKLKEAGALFGLPEDRLFLSLDEFLKANVECDIVVNATMDQMHYETAMAILEKGYNMLLEKPITADKNELLAIEKKAKEKGVYLFVCHVMRYSPYFVEIKRLINKGVIGEIFALEMNEHVSAGHFVNSYVRGRWHSEAECGSSFLLAKCCHDLDLMCWLNNKSEPKAVSSFGSRGYFKPEFAPEDSAEYCYDCPRLHTCMYSAKLMHLDNDSAPYVTWEGIKKPLDEITKEEKIAYLKTSIFGQCVYKIDTDLVDRQCVSVNFANGSVGTLNMIGGTTRGGRNIHITGSKGEIEGYWESSEFVLRIYNANLQEYAEKRISVKDKLTNTGHMGSDFEIMKSIVAYLNGDRESVSITSIDDSINGHLCVYAADESRKEGRIVFLEEYKQL
ncbi:MAG: Gfo/Idh/MocA family oxidoreductase [Clostridia bacterium]|nr:Gfo/Idh/MocA family oxidoreductase [Clostridia bacterium]